MSLKRLDCDKIEKWNQFRRMNYTNEPTEIEGDQEKSI